MEKGPSFYHLVLVIAGTSVVKAELKTLTKSFSICDCGLFRTGAIVSLTTTALLPAAGLTSLLSDHYPEYDVLPTVLLAELPCPC